MIVKSLSDLLLCTVVALLLLVSPIAATPTMLGITYKPSAPNLPSPELVRLLDPTPAAVCAFAYTNISLLLSVPNHLIPSFAANRSSTTADGDIAARVSGGAAERILLWIVDGEVEVDGFEKRGEMGILRGGEWGGGELEEEDGEGGEGWRGGVCWAGSPVYMIADI